MFKSFSKSRKVWKLQRIIWPPEETTSFSFNLDKQFQQHELREKALEEYIDLCVSDEGVAKVIKQYGITRKDLKEIYKKLVAAGMGQYVKGHFLALSTIAYYEPLFYYAAANQKGNEFMSIIYDLMNYWQGRIHQGGLVKMLEQDDKG